MHLPSVPPIVKKLAVGAAIVAGSVYALTRFTPGLAQRLGMRPMPFADFFRTLPAPLGFGSQAALSNMSREWVGKRLDPEDPRGWKLISDAATVRA